MWVRGLSLGFMCHLVHLNSQTRNRTLPDCAQVFALNDEGTSDRLGESEHSGSEETAKPLLNSARNTRKVITTITTVMKDPVCGMDVETATVADRTEHTSRMSLPISAACGSTWRKAEPRSAFRRSDRGR